MQTFGFIAIAAALVVSVIVFAFIERKVRSWPEDNWTHPTTKREALMNVVLPLVFYGMLALAMILLVTTQEPSETGPSTVSPLFAVAAVIGALAGAAMVAAGLAKADKAPKGAVRFSTPSGRFGASPERVVLAQTAILASLTSTVQAMSARILGVPAVLVHLARYGLVALFLVFYFLFIIDLA